MKFGKLKEVRIVTFRSGKSKGLAYVEFQDEQSAAKALLQTDGMLIGEHQISVAISNPPKRDKSEDNKQILTSSLGAGSLSSRIKSGDLSSKNKDENRSSISTLSSFIPRSQLVNRKKTLNL